MSRRTVIDGSVSYSFSPDDAYPLSSRYWALVSARLVDELTGRPPATDVSVESDLVPSTPRIAGDGLVGVVGVPRHLLQSLAIRGFEAHLTVRARGFTPRARQVDVPSDQRALAAPIPALGGTVVTLNDASRLRSGESLLIGPPGPTMAAVQIKALGPGPGQVTFAPGVTHLYAVGDPVFPMVQSDFATVDLQDLKLHREPVVISGRVVQSGGVGTLPLAGATVRIIGLWRTPPPAHIVVPPDPANLIALDPPLYADRPAGLGRLRRQDLPPIVDPIPQEKRLVDDTGAGATTLHLSNRLGLGIGTVLLLDAEVSDLQEHLTITAFSGALNPAQPARVTLDHPMAYDHRRGALVQRVNPQPQGPQRILAPDPLPGEPDALAGDTTLLLNTLAGLATGQTVRVSGGVAPPEYHRLARYSVTSDADGYYRLPPLGRVAQLRLRAENVPLVPIELEYRPDYTQRENRLDLLFR
ncbi:MAG TPA: hypothetical protein VGN26_07065 [Armatimonadota bacterium]|jgi:hypothetical protein